MTGPKILVGAATRYIAGRNALQTVYWKSKGAADSKMVKFSKTFKMSKNYSPPEKSTNAVNLK